jgi:hypothetical protein
LERTVASFFRTAASAEIDLLLEIPGHGLWAIEISAASPADRSRVLHRL